MTHFSFARPRGGARLAARQPGPVTLAIRAMRPNEAPSWELRQAQIDAEERAALRDLRKRIKAQMDADFDRIDRCLTILDAMDGDADLEADFATVEMAADGSLFTLGRSSDDEPSVSGDDREHDDAERGIGDMDGAIEQFGRAVGQNSVFA